MSGYVCEPVPPPLKSCYDITNLLQLKKSYFPEFYKIEN